MTEQDLFRLKKKVDDAKDTVNELKGQQTALLKQLKEEWKCSTIEEAEKKRNVLVKEIDELTNKIEKGIAELEEKYEL